MNRLPAFEQLLNDPLVAALARGEESAWFRDRPVPAAEGIERSGISPAIVADARARFRRFAPWFADRFPDTRPAYGIIESPLLGAPAMQRDLGTLLGKELPGRLWIKRDDVLPVSGSIKARGGIHEVLQLAEQLLADTIDLDRSGYAQVFASPGARKILGSRGITVASTGNLGLSIGIVASELGFRTTVHMSVDARAWKKELLRSRGVEVIEHNADFSAALRAARGTALSTPDTHFIDDEDSLGLFAGYAVAGARLAGQLAALEVPVDADNPLFVHLPCGVGGGPGGVTFGLKLAFGDAVHCVFAEPTRSPAMSLGVRSGLHDQICVADIGLDGRTAADGLAVGRPSRLVGQRMQDLVDGYVTVSDERMKSLVGLLQDAEGIAVEPSAAAGFTNPWRILSDDAYLAAFGLDEARLAAANHIVWSTGGGMVPAPEMDRYVEEGRSLLRGAGWVPAAD